MVHTESTRDTLRTRAHAKVNLALAVGQVNESGLHLICSWMHGVELYDEIEIRRVPDGQESSFAIGWKQAIGDDLPVAWNQDADLSVRAHTLVQTHVGRLLGVKVRVSKSIPAGGGLGGGSSDAAGVLMGLNTLFALGLDQQTLAGLAMRLGSDVPFFIDPGYPSPRPAIVRGVGGMVERVECKYAGTPIGLILPRFGCATGLVYGAFDETIHPDHFFRDHQVCALAAQETLDECGLFNDLAGPACCIAPKLGLIKAEIEGALGQSVHVSGSGSTLFVVGEIEQGVIDQSGSDYRVVQTRLC